MVRIEFFRHYLQTQTLYIYILEWLTSTCCLLSVEKKRKNIFDCDKSRVPFDKMVPYTMKNVFRISNSRYS